MTNIGGDDGGRNVRRMVAIDAFAGAIAGVCADGLMHPADTLKARLQSQRGPPFKYNSTWHAFQTIVAKEGIRRGLYAGFSAVLLGTIPTHAIMFATYKSTQRGVEPKVSDEYVPAVDFAAGAFGELCSLVTYMPAEVVAKRLQVAGAGLGLVGRNYNSTFHALRVIHRTEGVPGLYTGVFSTLLRDVPYTAMQFAMFEKGKRVLSQDRQQDISDWEAGVLGLGVGAVAAVLTNPMDVVKTRMQVQMPGTSRQYRNAGHCFTRIVQEEGLAALISGVGPRVLWVAPSSAITLSVYEAVSRHLR